MSDKDTARPAPGMTFPDCPHWGHGGRFKIDLANGRRVPVTELAEEGAPTEAAHAAADEHPQRAKAHNVKEKKRA